MPNSPRTQPTKNNKFLVWTIPDKLAPHAMWNSDEQAIIDQALSFHNCKDMSLVRHSFGDGPLVQNFYFLFSDLTIYNGCFSKPLKWCCLSFTHSNVMEQWTLWNAAKVSPARLKLLHGSLVRSKLARASDCRALFGGISNRRARV